MIIFSFNTLTKFWKQHPALLYALGLMLGVYSALNWNWSLLIPIFLVFVPLGYCLKNRDGIIIRFTLVFGIFTTTFIFVKLQYQFPTLPSEGISGTAHIAINSLAASTTHFGKQWSYKGTIYQFVPDDSKFLEAYASNIPFKLSIPQNSSIRRPLADRAYKIHGRLKESSPGYYTFNVRKEEPWHSVKESWSLAEYRFHAKEYVKAYITQHIPGKRSATFLSGIATGEFDDRLMLFEFSRFGLQHIMAISGFHFAIVAGILSTLLRLVIAKKKATLLLIFLLSSYFIFLGCAPSIMRAWITILIALASFLFQRRASGLNSLGVALLLILFFDPLLCRNLGFQFSFLSTASILLFYSSSDLMIQKVFAKRSLAQMIDMNYLNQHGYFILSCFRQAISLTIAVSVIAIPMTLYFFNKFPVLSLIYNLFFPFLVSISMLLLLLGIMMGIVFFPLGNFLHSLNNNYTNFVLNFTYNMPTTLDYTWRTTAIPIEFAVGYISILFCFGICLKYYLEENRENLEDFSFL